MGNFNRFLAIAICGTIILGCDAFGFEKTSVKMRAANDLKCDEDQLHTDEIGNHSWKVSGCQKEATYTCIHGEGVGEQQWSCMKEK